MAFMAKEKKKRIVYFQSYEDDVVESSDQQYVVPDDYAWICEGWKFKAVSTLMYGLIRILSPIYCRGFLHMRIVNKELLDQNIDGGCCLFANHTQPVGDALLPVWINRRRRIYVIVSPANLGIPVIGKAIPYLGALPATGRIQDLRKLNQAIKQRLKEKQCLVVYPEAHVWPYYTGVRPFSEASFLYPVAENVPAYCMTTTYQKRRFGKKPRATVYIDGPFFPLQEGSKRDRANDLRRQVYECMQNRSRSSTYEYIQYVKGGEA